MMRSLGRRIAIAAAAALAVVPALVAAAPTASAGPPLYSKWVKYPWSPCVYDTFTGTSKWVSPDAYNQAGRPSPYLVYRMPQDKIVRNVTRSDEVFVISPPVTSSGAPGECGSWHHMSRAEWDAVGNPSAISTGRKFNYDCNMVSGPIYNTEPNGVRYHLSRSSWEYYGFPTPESPRCTWP